MRYQSSVSSGRVSKANARRSSDSQRPRLIRTAGSRNRSGRGLGKRVLAVARNADLALFIVDVFQPEARMLLENELKSTGIRVDTEPPNVVIAPSSTGGLSVTNTVKLTKISEQLVKEMLRVYEYNSARSLSGRT